MGVCVEQQRERRVGADVLGEQEGAGARELTEVTVKGDGELIGHQKRLVCRRETKSD